MFVSPGIQTERLTLVELALVQVSELVHLRCLASNNTLGELGKATNCGASSNGILCRDSLDLDKNNSWILWATVMLSIAQIANPCLQSRRVVLADLFSVGLDGGLAGYGSPLAAGGQEGEVDVGVVLEIVRLAGFAVGVEYEVNAIALLVKDIVSAVFAEPLKNM